MATLPPYGSGLPPAPRPKSRIFPFLAGASLTIPAFIVGVIGGSGSTQPPIVTVTSAPMLTVQAPAGTVLHGGGTYLVGNGNGKIQPGTWQTPGAADRCYWARLTNTTGDLGSIAANEIIDGGPGVVTVSAQDAALKLDGPCVWTRQ